MFVSLCFLCHSAFALSVQISCLHHGISCTSRLHSTRQKAQECYLDKSLLQVRTGELLLAFTQVGSFHIKEIPGCITPFPQQSQVLFYFQCTPHLPIRGCPATAFNSFVIQTNHHITYQKVWSTWRTFH